MKLFRALFIIICVCAPILSAAAPALETWEPISGNPVDAHQITAQSDIEILAAPGCIIVSASKQVDIKVFSILGKLVSQETLQPGTSKLSVSSHGIFIVKAGELTCKVAI